MAIDWEIRFSESTAHRTDNKCPSARVPRTRKTSQLPKGARESGCPRERSGNHVFRFNFSAVPVTSQLFGFLETLRLKKTVRERRDASEVA